MGLILISAAAAIAVFIAILLFTPQLQSAKDQRKKALLAQMSQEAHLANQQRLSIASVMQERNSLHSAVTTGTLSKIPKARDTYNLLLRAGFGKKIEAFALGVVILFIVLMLALHKLGIWGLLLAIMLTVLLPRYYLKRRIRKRNDLFLSMFPDAIDMIVRSVRSGHPLNIAMRMIVENMDDPVAEEFRQVVDEVAYGRTLTEALSRMGNRVDEPDLNFFIVVLSVQQETGGSLAEVLTNLSTIIRKRRQLRLKIRALTSEGRATSWVLGALPVVEFGAVYFTSPDYMQPLFESLAGNIIFGVACALVIAALWVTRAIVNNIDI